MPYREKSIKKTRWVIGEIANELTIKPSTIRFWCDQFELTPARRSHNHREFNEKERALIHKIYKLSRMGLTHYGIREFLEQPKEFIYELIYLKDV